MRDYIQYVKSLNIMELDNSVKRFESNQISFDELQLIVIESGGVTLHVFEKEKKLRIILTEIQ